MHIDDTGCYPRAIDIDDTSIVAQGCRLLTHSDNSAVDKVETRRLKFLAGPVSTVAFIMSVGVWLGA